MKFYILAALLNAGPCTNATQLSAGMPAPCGGILIAREQAQQALQCVRVELPKLKSELRFARSHLDATRMSCNEKSHLLQEALTEAETKQPWWVAPLVGAAFFSIGYAFGSFTMSIR